MPSTIRHPGRRSRGLRARAWISSVAVLATTAGVLLGTSSSAGAVPATAAVVPGGGGVVMGLDTSGQTVPDTDYPIPDGAVFLSTDGNDGNDGSQAAPFATLTHAIDAAPPGGTVVVRGGVYRDGYGATGLSKYGVVSKPVTVQAYPHEQVWFDGTDVVTGNRWTRVSAGRWAISWVTPGFCNGKYYQRRYNAQAANNTGPCTHIDMARDPANPAAGDPQMVFVNGQYVHEVTSLAALKPGTFFYDWAKRKLYITSDPSANRVELAARPELLLADGKTSVQLLGIGVRRYATNEYPNNTTSAVNLQGPNSVIENSVFTQMAGGGAGVGSRGGVIRDSVLVDNGYDGLGGNGSYAVGSYVPDGLLVEGNYVARNNAEKFGTNCRASCSQAGMKFAHMNGLTVRDNVVEDNNGHGIWCDLACSDGVIVDNVVRRNARAGIFYEVSDTGIIASNLVVANGGYGIRVTSANTRIYNNTVVDNTGSGGIWIYDDNRSLNFGGWADVGPDTTNVEFANNIVSDSLPNDTLLRISIGGTDKTNTAPAQFFSVFDDNAYYRAASSEKVVRWLSTSSVNYLSLSDFSTAQGLDQHSVDITVGGDPFFADTTQGDFTVRDGSPAFATGMPLPDDVAAAVGVPPDAGQNLGALVWPGLSG